MKKENLFEEYIKPEMVVIDVEMESAVLVGSVQEEVSKRKCQKIAKCRTLEING